MNIADILSLAKQGYKPSDIKELIELTNAAEQQAPVIPETAEPDIETAEDPDNKPIDYKALYEAQTEELNKLKADNKKANEDLKQAQKDNINKDISADIVIESPKKILEDFFKAR